jgi:hypothetical protein
MRNGRPYSTWRIEPLCAPPEGDFNGSGFIDWDDMKFFSYMWLRFCSPGNEYCNGCDIDNDLKVNFKDYALFAPNFLTGCD